MICQKCGKEISDESGFCANCGAAAESSGIADTSTEHRNSTERSSELLRLQNDMLRQLINLQTSCDERLRRIKRNTAVITFIMLLPFILVILGLIFNVSLTDILFKSLRYSYY